MLEAPLPELGGLDIRAMPGGALVQDRDVVAEGRDDFGRSCPRREPTEDEWRDLLLAWTIAWRVKSNTIVLVRDGATVGVGAGQMSRVDSSWIATRKAGDRAKGASLASDAFFPFPDALEVAADAGATAVIHPGGSKGDDDVIGRGGTRDGGRAHRTPPLPALTSLGTDVPAPARSADRIRARDRRILDGKAVAAQIRSEVAERVRALADHGVTPGLAAVLVGDDQASRIYVGAKHKACADVGIRSEQVDLPGYVTEHELLATIRRLNRDPEIHGIIVQLPLPAT